MMASDQAVLVQLAEKLKQVINEHDFGLQFECERSYADWDLKLERADELRVDVVPVGHPVSELETRGSVLYQCAVDIGIRKRFEPVESEASTGRIKVAEVDRLVLLVEQIHEFLCGWDERTLADGFNWRETKIRFTYDPDMLKNMRQFFGLIRVTYDCDKDLEPAT